MLKEIGWRVGRALYQWARDERGNDILTNGEDGLIRQVARAFPGDAVFVDVGANIGDWSDRVLAHCGSSCRLELVEPAPQSRARLQSRFPGRPVHACALSDHNGTARLGLVDGTAGQNSLGATGKDAIEVRTITGSAFFKEAKLDRVHLFKVDAEGFDARIIAGLLPILTERRIVVLQFEYNALWLQQGDNLFRLFAMIEGLPYRLARVTGAGLVEVPEWRAEIDRFFEANYALVLDEEFDRLGVKRASWSSSNTLKHTQAA